MCASKSKESRPESRPPGPAGGGQADQIEGLRMRSPEAMDVFVRTYQNRVFNVIYRLCGHYEDALDLTQETFCRAIQSAGDFRGTAGLFTWLYRIAVNLTISHQRRLRRRRSVALEANPPDGRTGRDDPAARPASAQPGPDELAASGELYDKIVEALDRLDADYRAVVVFRDIEDLDYRQISEILGIPVGTVKSRLHRARLALRKQLRGIVDVSMEHRGNA